MASFNRVILMGNLTRDPEVRYSGGGNAVVKIGIAVNRRVKRGDKWEDEANFFDAVIFGKRGEAVGQHFGKGDPILIEGELVQQRWETQDGQKRSKVEVQVVNFAFVGGRDKPEARNPRPAASNASGNDAPPSFEDDDIPF